MREFKIGIIILMLSYGICFRIDCKEMKEHSVVLKQPKPVMYPLSKEVVHIRGFSQYPTNKFYRVDEDKYRRIFVNPIEADTIIVRSDVPRRNHNILWDTRFMPYKLGVPLSGYGYQYIKRYVSADYNEFNPTNLKVPFLEPIRKISDIESYYKIAVLLPPYDINGDTSEYTFILNPVKRVYRSGSHKIDITDNFKEMEILIGMIINRTDNDYSSGISDQEASIIKAYADSLRLHKTSLNIILQNGFPYRITLAKTPIDKPPVTGIDIDKPVITRPADTRENYRKFFWLTLIVSILIKVYLMLMLFKLISSVSVWTQIKPLILACIGMTVFTITLIWWVLPALIYYMLFRWVVSVAFAVITEGLLYGNVLRIKTSRAMLLSLTGNLVSYFACFMLISYLV